MKKNVRIVASLLFLLLLTSFFCFPSSMTGFLMLNVGNVFAEENLPPLPSLESIHKKYNQRNADEFPLGDIEHSSGNYFGCPVVINGVFSGSLRYQTYDTFSMQGFSIEIHTIHDSKPEDKKNWIRAQILQNALDFNNEHSRTIWFSKEILQAIWPEMTEGKAYEIILGAMKALVNNDFDTLDFTYFKKLKEDGQLGNVGKFPTYKGCEFYFESGNNWIGLNIRRATLQPAQAYTGITLEQLSSEYFKALQRDLKEYFGKDPRSVGKSTVTDTILSNAPSSGNALSYLLSMNLADAEDIFLLFISSDGNENIALCMDDTCYLWDSLPFLEFIAFQKQNLESIMEKSLNPPYLPIEVLVMINDSALKLDQESLTVYLNALSEM